MTHIIACLIRKVAFVTVGIVKYMPFMTALKIRNLCYRTILKKMGARSNIADGVTIMDPTRLSVGRNVSIHAYTMIGAGDVTIGDYVMIASSCCIISATHTFPRKDVPIKRQEVTARPVIIEDDVWLGCGVIVLDGVTIGKGAVIGAGSVVTKDIPAWAVAVGIPCKAIRFR